MPYACMQFVYIYIHIYIHMYIYVVHIRALKQALNHALTLKKVHGVIKFSQKTQLKSYIDMNTKLRIQAKFFFEKKFFKLMNN